MEIYNPGIWFGLEAFFSCEMSIRLVISPPKCETFVPPCMYIVGADLCRECRIEWIEWVSKLDSKWSQNRVPRAVRSKPRAINRQQVPWRGASDRRRPLIGSVGQSVSRDLNIQKAEKVSWLLVIAGCWLYSNTRCSYTSCLVPSGLCLVSPPASRQFLCPAFNGCQIRRKVVYFPFIYSSRAEGKGP